MHYKYIPLIGANRLRIVVITPQRPHSKQTTLFYQRTNRMTQLITYLSFNGNCREAMHFYHSCFGGKLSFQTVGEVPLSKKLPPSMKKFILHSTLRKKNLLLMGTDMVGDYGLIKGNTVSILVDCNSEKEIKSLYEKLGKDAIETHPIVDTEWGSMFGGLTDKYGNNWLFNYNNFKSSKNGTKKISNKY